MARNTVFRGCITLAHKYLIINLKGWVVHQKKKYGINKNGKSGLVIQ